MSCPTCTEYTTITRRRIAVFAVLLVAGVALYAITGNVAASILGAGLGGAQLGDHL